MARPIRVQFSGATYHIMSRGNGRQNIFKDKKDYEKFLDVYEEVLKKYNIISYAYCLMPNHYHLFIETPDPNLSISMRQLNGKYTQAFNIRHKVLGHLFQGRYKSILVDMDNYAYEVIRYIVLNPVKAKMVKYPGQWKWSSHNEMTGKLKPTKCLDLKRAFKLYDNNQDKAKENYIKNINLKMEEDLLDKELGNKTILGSIEFIDKIKKYFKQQSKSKEIPKIERFAHRPDLEEIFKGIKDKVGRNKNIYTELGDPDWDLVISKLDRWNQKLWMRGFKKRYIKLYKNKQEVNLILKRYNNKFYTFLVQVNKEDYVICDWISIRLVRVAQKRNILAKEKIISLLVSLVDQWIENDKSLFSWKGYNELIIQQIEGCVRRFRYTGSFLGYLYRTLQYSGLGLVPLEKFSFDDFLLTDQKRRIDIFIK